MFSTFSTYIPDVALFEKLGLTPIVGGKCHKDIHVGKVVVEGGGTVDLTVHAMPAQFWTAIIYNPESRKETIIKTGSGTLMSYWPTFEAIAQNMIVIESVTMRSDDKNITEIAS